MKEIIATPEAPAALGPYSQAVKVNDTIYISGQIPINPRTNQLVEGGVVAQTEQCLDNIRAILEEAGASLDDIVKVTVYMVDLDHFDEMNGVYSLFFPISEGTHNLLPARVTVQVSRLPRGSEVEIDAIAVITPPEYHTPELF